MIMFQSQTRRLLPRNIILLCHANEGIRVSIADATLASPQQYLRREGRIIRIGFNRRRDACFPAT